MIRIEKPIKVPKILTTKGVGQTRKDCAAYDRYPRDYRSGSKKFDFKSNIYSAKSVKTILLKAQHNKCCYCESKLFPSSPSYGAVEHFRPKGAKQGAGQSEEYPGYYWLAYDWNNLLVSCGPCNSSHKRNLFPLNVNGLRARSHHDDIKAEQPLFINPTLEDPRSHIRFRREVPTPITEIGRVTIEGLGLRKRPDLKEPRRKRLAELKRSREIIELAENSNDPRWLSLKEKEAKLLKSAILPEAEYSAMAQDFLDSDSYSTGNE